MKHTDEVERTWVSWRRGTLGALGYMPRAMRRREREREREREIDR
jgi:hypothetical protein